MKRWSEAEARAGAAFGSAIRRAGWPAGDPRRWKFEDSATHREVREGVLPSSCPDGAALAYVREFEQPPRPDDEDAAEFIDVVEGKADEAAGARLQELRKSLSSRLEATGGLQVYRIADHNCLRAKRLDAATALRIQALCDSIERDLSAVIDEELQGCKARGSRESSEAAAHAQFASERSATMVGRRSSLSRIERYLRGRRGVPLVVLGASGSGKTTLLAKASREAMLQVGPETQQVAVARFVGASPRSTSLASFLGDLCAEIAAAYGDATPVPSDPEQATSHLAAHAMKLATADRPLWLFLDGLEQLMGEAPGRELEWLPRRLPAHVKVVLSAGSAAKARWPQSVVTLAGLDARDTDELLAVSLGEASRTLQPRQRVHVRTRFARNGLPLYLKLALEEVRRWRSWEGLPRGATGKAGLPGSVAGIVEALFQRLSQPREHGPMLVRRVFSYLAASRHGLADSEMVELLSTDRRVMDDFIRRSPTERAKPEAERVQRLPWIVWSRLESDLAPYLLRRGIDGVVVATFLHRQVGEAAARLYLAPGGSRATHHALARYFRGRADPTSDGSWSGADARGFANLAYHLAHSAQARALHRMLLDYRWLEAKLRRLGIASLLEDFSWVPLEHSAALARKALELSRDALATPRRHLASQLLGRLRGFRSPQLRTMLERAQAETGAWALKPLSRSLTPPTTAETRVLRGHRGEVRGVALTPDARMVVSCSFDALKVWDARIGALIRTVERKGGQWTVAVTPDGKRMLAGTHDQTVEAWDIASGRRARPTLRGHGHAVNSVAISRDGRLAVTGSSDSTARSWNLETGKCLATFSEHTGIVRAVALSPDGRLAFSASNDRTVRAWDPRTGVQKRSLAHDDFVFAVAASDDGHHLLTGAGDGTLRLWDLRRQERPRPLAAHEGFVYDAVFLRGWRHAASCGYDHTVRLWELGSTKPPRVLIGHAGPVNALAATRDGRRLVSGSWDGTVRIWDLRAPLETGYEARHSSAIRALAVTPDGRHALSAADDGQLRIWDLAKRRSAEPHKEQQAPIAIAPDGAIALTAGGTGYAQELVALDLRTRRVLWRRPYFDPGEGADNWTVNSIAITPDGRHALVGSTANELTVWDVASGNRLRKLRAHDGCINSVRIAHRARVAVTGSNDGTVRVWTLDGEMTPSVLGTMDAIVEHVVVTSDGRVVVAAPSREGPITAWDTAMRKPLWTADISRTEEPTVPGHVAYVSDMAVTPNDEGLVIASEDHSLTVRDLRDGTVRASFVGDTAMLACGVTPDGGLILAGERSGRLHFLRLEGRAPTALQGYRADST